MDHLKYLSSFFFPVSVACFLYTAPYDAMGALAWTIPLWTLVLIDWLSPAIDPNKQKTIVSDWFYNVIIYCLTLLQFLIISLMLIYASQLAWETPAEIIDSVVNLVVMRILVGTTSGSSAIIVAHELLHRSRLQPRILGRLLLYTVCYEHFVIAHMRGHHNNVATLNDITTARLDESFNAYWKRVTRGHFKYAWCSERQRLEQQPVILHKILANSVLHGVMIEVTMLVLILLVFGWAAGFIFLYQAYSGVRLLETINYYQHWGLENGQSKNMLAWVNPSLVTEYTLVGLSNHIAHHQNASRYFYQLPYSMDGPIMPYGYFVTNLWVKLNNASYCRVSKEKIKAFDHLQK